MKPQQPVQPAQSISDGHSDLRPRDAATGQARTQTPQPGYYPGYSTMGQRGFWDKTTRTLVEQRVQAPPPIRFFSPAEAEFWAAVFDHILPQHDRTPDRRIPIVPFLDDRLHHHRTVGYRFEDMPHDRDVYKTLAIQAINQEAQAEFNNQFLQLSWQQQDIVLRNLHDGDPQAAPDIWKQMSVHRFWQLLTSDAIDVYYAHPWAWDEIGFGGPAYPRAYTRLERGEPEPWEVEEERYNWLAPSDAVSDVTDDASHHHTEAEQHRHPHGKRSA